MRQWGFSLPCIADWSLSVANVSPLTLSGNNFPSQKRKHIWAEIGWNWPKSAICVMQMIRTHVSNRMSGVVPADSAKVVFCSFSWYLYPPSLPHQAGIELSDFHARGWKSDQGGRNSMQEMHGNQTKCMEFRPIKENSNFWTSIFCPGINFSCSKSLWIWWTIDPLILACLKLMTYASFSTKELLAVLMDGNPCTNGWNSMHQNRKNVIASCFFEQSCLRQVKIQDPWQT